VKYISSKDSEVYMSKKARKINRQMAKGSAWMLLFKIVEKGLSIFSTIILARLLVPEDFGLVAIAMMVKGFLELMRTFGVDMALIQNQEATREHYDTAWTFKILSGLVVAIALVIITPFVTTFYDDDRLLKILPVLAFGVFISGFENIGIITFRKELTFHKDFAYLVMRKIIGFVTVVVLAFYLRNYWALIGSFIATNIGVVILSYILHHYRPRFCLSKSRELLGFSAWILLNTFLRFLFTRAPDIIIGKIAGLDILGIFNVSKRIILSTSTALVVPINRATFPGYSKLNNDLFELKNTFLNTLSMIAITIIPASTGLSAITPIMVPTLLGHQWLSTVPVMQILAFTGLLYAISNMSSIYFALGKPRIVTMIQLVRILVFVPTLIYGTSAYGVIGAAYSTLATSIIALPFSYLGVFSILKIRLYNVFSIFIRPILASAVMYLVIDFIYSHYMQNEAQEYQLFELISLIAIGAATYISIILLLWQLMRCPKGSERIIIEEVRKKIFN
jgi:lipopolysaccharide exporter